MRGLANRIGAARDGGYSLVEMLTSMAILSTVMAGLAALMVSGTKAEVDMNKRFQAQTQARLGLDQLRREVHCASSASPTGATASVTLTLAATCPTSGGNTTITWCTVANGASWELWRYPGAACSGTGTKVAEHLTTQNAFSYGTPSGSLAKLGVTLAVNLTPAVPARAYILEDSIVLRNSTRAT